MSEGEWHLSEVRVEPVLAQDEETGVWREVGKKATVWLDGSLVRTEEIDASWDEVVWFP